MTKNKQFDALIDTLVKIDNTKDMENFIRGILTVKELEEMPSRLAIVRMLKKGISQHTISEKLNVGIATVTRGSKEIKMGRFKVV